MPKPIRRQRDLLQIIKDHEDELRRLRSKVARIPPPLIVKTDTGDPASGLEGQHCINTFDNTLKMYAEGAWRSIATSW